MTDTKMFHYGRCVRGTTVLAALAGSASNWLWAQTPQGPLATPVPGPAAVLPTAAPPAGMAAGMLDKVGGALPIIVIAALVVVGIVVYMMLRRGNDTWNEEYEPEPVASVFEQLMAEIQGLRLRLQGGESRGYYRKIETLARIYCERSGLAPGARQLSDEELMRTLTGNGPQGQASGIQSIIERSKRGARNENEKQDFTAEDLLKELQALIRQSEAGAIKVA